MVKTTEIPPNGLTFAEWVAWDEAEIGELIPLDWAKQFIAFDCGANRHFGDCTKSPQSCYLCVLEQFLSEYREYRFNVKKEDDL